MVSATIFLLFIIKGQLYFSRFIAAFIEVGENDRVRREHGFTTLCHCYDAPPYALEHTGGQRVCPHRVRGFDHPGGDGLGRIAVSRLAGNTAGDDSMDKGDASG